MALWKMLAVFVVLAFVVAGCGGNVEEQAGQEGQDGGNGEGGGGEPAQNVTGAGATFPAPLYSEMFQAFAEESGIQVNYQSVGSGAGIEQFTQRTVDFGASDAPMSDEEMEQAGGSPVHVATVGGAVVPIFNVEGVEELNLTEEAIAGIYLGQITSWDDPEIAEANPDVELPAEEIQVVRRSDGSGTTNIWTSYLSAISDEWEQDIGAGTEVAWPVGSGGDGNDGVAAQVNQTPNAIGYVELAYATENDIPFASIGETVEGPFVEANQETAANAIETADVPDDLRLTISSANPIAEDAYPVVGLTWLLIRQEMDDPAVCQAVAEAAWFATHDGQEFAPPDYVPIGGRTLEISEEFIRGMQAGGEPCYQE